MANLIMSDVDTVMLGSKEVQSISINNQIVWEKVEEELEYFTVQLQPGEAGYLRITSSSSDLTGRPDPEYSFDGVNWTKFRWTSTARFTGTTTFAVSSSQKIYIRNNTGTWGYLLPDGSVRCYSIGFYSTYNGTESKGFYIRGNIGTLLKNDGKITEYPDGCFLCLFGWYNNMNVRGQKLIWPNAPMGSLSCCAMFAGNKSFDLCSESEKYKTEFRVPTRGNMTNYDESWSEDMFKTMPSSGVSPNTIYYTYLSPLYRPPDWDD